MLLASEDIKQKQNERTNERTNIFWTSESRRDQEEGGELDSHEEVRLPFAGPGEIKRREVVLDPEESPVETKNRQVKLGSESWTCLLLPLFLNSSAPHSS